MEKANFKNDNYVLFKRVGIPENGDIIVGGVCDNGIQKAKVKRYFRDGEQIILQSESDDLLSTVEKWLSRNFRES